jgi:hypothetical protein
MTAQASAALNAIRRLAASLTSGVSSRTGPARTKALSPSGFIDKDEVFDTPEASLSFRGAGNREACASSSLEIPFVKAPISRIQSTWFPTIRDGLATVQYERHKRMARGKEWIAPRVLEHEIQAPAAPYLSPLES